MRRELIFMKKKKKRRRRGGGGGHIQQSDGGMKSLTAVSVPFRVPSERTSTGTYPSEQQSQH